MGGGVDGVESGWCHRVAVLSDDVALVADGELSGGGIDPGDDESALWEAGRDVPAGLDDLDGVMMVDGRRNVTRPLAMGSVLMPWGSM